MFNVPSLFYAGASASWSESLTDYPAPAWVLTLTMISAGHKITVVGTASGAAHAFAVDAVVSADYVPGKYKWQLSAAAGAAVVVVGSGSATVAASFAGVESLDGRTHAEKMVEALQAVLENRGTQDYVGLTVAGRSIQKMSLAELRAALVDYRAEVAREARAADKAAGIKPRGKFLARFP